MKPKGFTNAELSRRRESLLEQAVKEEAIAMRALPSTYDVIRRAGEISGLEYSTGWLFAGVGSKKRQGSTGSTGLHDYLRQQGVYEAVIVDGVVYSSYFDGTPNDSLKIHGPGGGNEPQQPEKEEAIDVSIMSQEQLYKLLGEISVVLQSRDSQSQPK